MTTERCSMGEIKINIPKDMETAFEAAFPGEDKAGAILRLIQAEIAKRRNADATAGEESFDALVEAVLRVRNEPPYFTDDEIRRAREELRG
jgi:hypothetical protein